ncbi:TH1 family protein [Pelomyxa schiedti]|nr:TH1 family protein [Pelomyxa schiedti]
MLPEDSPPLPLDSPSHEEQHRSPSPPPSSSSSFQSQQAFGGSGAGGGGGGEMAEHLGAHMSRSGSISPCLSPSNTSPLLLVTSTPTSSVGEISPQANPGGGGFGLFSLEGTNPFESRNAHTTTMECDGGPTLLDSSPKSTATVSAHADSIVVDGVGSSGTERDAKLDEDDGGGGGGGGGGSPEDSKAIENLKSKLCEALVAPDAALESDVGLTMKNFVKAGGTPQEIITMLVDHYRGYSQMVNLLCDWGVHCGALSPEAIQKLVGEQLMQLVLSHFDRAIADSILMENDAVPEWLVKMIQNPQWRNLIYKLSEKHESCVLLNLAIQLISDSGHTEEISTIPSAVQNFRIFNQVLKNLLSQIITADELKLQQLLPDLKKLCAHNEHAYFYVQVFLHKLAAHPNGAHLKRLITELQCEGSHRENVIVQINCKLSKLDNYPSIQQPICSLTKGVCAPSDVSQLYTEFKSQAPPPVKYIRKEEIMRTLLKELFDPVKQVSEQHKEKCIYLLAYASSALESHTMTQVQAQQQEHPGQCSTSAIAVDLSEVHRITPALASASSLCKRGPFGHDLASSMPTLQDLCQYPVISMGILYWVERYLTDVDTQSSFPNVAFDLVLHIVQIHRMQWPSILSLIKKCFEQDLHNMEAVPQLELKKHLLSVLVELVRNGYPLPVLSLVHKWCHSSGMVMKDQALIRYFIIQTLDSISPPFSSALVVHMLQILSESSSKRAFAALERTDHSSAYILLKFLGDAQATKELPLETSTEITSLHHTFNAQFKL